MKLKLTGEFSNKWDISTIFIYLDFMISKTS